MRRTGGLIITTAIGIVLMAGCSGSPSADGEWEITVPVTEANSSEPQTGDIVYEADIQQAEDGGLAGSATASLDGYECEYEVLGPDNVSGTSATASRVSEDGDIVLNMEGPCQGDASWAYGSILLEGTVEGDEMTVKARDSMSTEEAADSLDAIAFAGEGAYIPLPETSTGERGSGGAESEVGSSDSGDSGNDTELASSETDGEDTGVPETTSTTSATSSGKSNEELATEFYEMDKELNLMGEELEGRISDLESAEEDLQEALGPETTDPDLFDCAADPVSCEVATLEDRVGEDRRDFEEEGYGPAGCEATSDTDYYAAFRDFDASGGETFVKERNVVTENSDGLEQYARDTLEMARETKAVYDEARAAGATVAEGISYSVDDVEPLVDEAAQAEERAKVALSRSEQRYGALKSRAAEALAEAEPLYARAGCAI